VEHLAGDKEMEVFGNIYKPIDILTEKIKTDVEMWDVASKVRYLIPNI
jgi:hypothetical protein